MSDTGTDPGETEADPDGNLAAVEPTSEGDESGDGPGDGSGNAPGGESDASTDATKEGEIDAGIDIDDDGEPEITLSGRGPIQAVLIFVIILFGLDVMFNGGKVTIAILDALADTAGSL